MPICKIQKYLMSLQVQGALFSTNPDYPVAQSRKWNSFPSSEPFFVGKSKTLNFLQILIQKPDSIFARKRSTEGLVHSRMQNCSWNSLSKSRLLLSFLLRETLHAPNCSWNLKFIDSWNRVSNSHRYFALIWFQCLQQWETDLLRWQSCSPRLLEKCVVKTGQ